MSKITITLNVLDVNGTEKGRISVPYHDGINQHNLTEVLVDIRQTGGQFNLEPNGNDRGQSLFFANAFDVDYRHVGGANNLLINVNVNDEIEITAKKGSFGIPTYDGNVLQISTVIENEPPDPTYTINVDRQDTGDCSNIDYLVDANGGTAPYRMFFNGAQVLSWDGTSNNIQIPRGAHTYISVLDSTDEEMGNTLVIPPRQLIPSEFLVNVVKFETYGDITITESNPVANTGDVEYSLDGTTWRTSNVFTGILPDTYTLSIRDRYGCVVTKTIVVDVVEAVEEQHRILEISNLNSLAWYKKRRGEKRNYTNSRPFEEIANISHNISQYVDGGDLVPTQFKSSYPYHNITYTEQDGTKTSLYPIKLTENMGFVEKVDCVLYPKSGKTAIYFDGGNSYVPNTTTVFDASEYNNYLPSWGVVGEQLSLDGKGLFFVESVGYDEDIKKWYLLINLVTASQENGKVQVTYNIQDYEVYEFFLSGATMSKKGFITLDAGYAYTKIDQSYYTGTLEKITDNCEYLYLEWFDTLNKGGLVFRSGTKHFARLKGMFQPYIKSESKTSEGDDRSYNLFQSTGVDYKLTIHGLNVKMQDKINSAAGLNGFYINGLNLIKDKQSGDRYGFTNLGTLELELLYSGNNLSLGDDEIILNPSTGIIGGDISPPTITPVTYDGKLRLITSNGSFVVINGDFVEVSDE